MTFAAENVPSHDQRSRAYMMRFETFVSSRKSMPLSSTELSNLLAPVGITFGLLTAMSGARYQLVRPLRERRQNIAEYPASDIKTVYVAMRMRARYIERWPCQRILWSQIARDTKHDLTQNPQRFFVEPVGQQVIDLLFA